MRSEEKASQSAFARRKSFASAMAARCLCAFQIKMLVTAAAAAEQTYVHCEVVRDEIEPLQTFKRRTRGSLLPLAYTPTYRRYER